jgi:hypothetical protein
MEEPIGLVQTEADTVIEITPVIVPTPVVQEVHGSLAFLRQLSARRAASTAF